MSFLGGLELDLERIEKEAAEAEIRCSFKALHLRQYGTFATSMLQSILGAPNLVKAIRCEAEQFADPGLVLFDKVLTQARNGKVNTNDLEQLFCSEHLGTIFDPQDLTQSLLEILFDKTKENGPVQGAVHVQFERTIEPHHGEKHVMVESSTMIHVSSVDSINNVPEGIEQALATEQIEDYGRRSCSLVNTPANLLVNLNRAFLDFNTCEMGISTKEIEVTPTMQVPGTNVTYELLSASGYQQDPRATGGGIYTTIVRSGVGTPQNDTWFFCSCNNPDLEEMTMEDALSQASSAVLLWYRRIDSV